MRGRVWGDGPVVYLVHGWGGVGAQLSEFVGPLLAHGFRVVLFDAPSHGRSDPGPLGPGRGHGVDFVRALGTVAARFGPAHAVVAHSLGAGATALALRAGLLTANRLVFLAPMTTVRDPLDHFATHLGLGPRSRRRLEAILGGDHGVGLDAFNLTRLAYADPAPLLVVHDRDDRRTPWAASAALAEAWPAARLVTTGGLGHTRLLTDPTVVDTVADYIAEETADPPTPRQQRATVNHRTVTA